MSEAKVERDKAPEAARPSDTPINANTKLSAWRTWVIRIAVAILVPLLLLAALEIGLRILNIGYDTELMQPCSVHGRPASCYNIFFPAPFFPPGVIKLPQVYALPVDKPQGTLRIVVLGESAAMGDPDPAYAFSRYLEVLLRQRFPQINFEVVNTGSVAINSHVLLLIAKGLSKQRPDLFIIYSGNNEVVGPYGPGTALTSSAMNLEVIRGSIFLRSTRIGQLLTKLGTQKQEWRGMEMFMDKQVPASSPLLANTYSNFEQNLRETIRSAQDAGAQVIVSTVATNAKDCAPFASMHRDDLSQKDLSAWSTLVQQGADFENEHSYDDALKAYLAALKIDDQYAELEFRIARTLWKNGDYAAANRHFERARDLDTLRFRADSRINEINRSVAGAISGTKLVDAATIFAQQSPNGVIGSELVYEHVHMTPEGNYLLARSMFLVIAAQIAGQQVVEYEVPSKEDCDRLLAFTPHDRQRISSEMAGRLQKPPFTNQLNHADQMLRLMIDAAGPPENPEQTVAEYQWAIAQKPDDRLLHYNFGRFLFNYDRQAGAEQMKLSQPWDGFPVFAPDGTRIQ